MIYNNFKKIIKNIDTNQDIYTLVKGKEVLMGDLQNVKCIYIESLNST